MRSSSLNALLLLALVAMPLAAQAPAKGELLARSILPAETFRFGPTSGRQLGNDPINGITVPFVNSQPVQGVSGILPLADGYYAALSDNGYGGMENSADYRLVVYLLKPDFKTPFGGPGRTAYHGAVELSDPNHLIPWSIVNEFIPGRPLTGADFDIESIQIAPDGTVWIGDEFGPFLLHFNLQGELIDAPIALPDGLGGEIRAPQNPQNEETSPVRIMNAVREHARLHGGDFAPVCSPWEVMVADGDLNTGVNHRQSAPAGSGLVNASSEIFNVQSLQNAGYPVVVWTVNDYQRMLDLLALGVDGIISDRPDLLRQAVESFDANGDGTPGDYLDAQGLIDPAKFDAQGHRGGRNLRPENTLPAMEVAMDHLMSTLELDVGISADGFAMLGHDAYISASKVRRTDGLPYTSGDEVLIKDLTRSQIQSRFIADQLLSGRPAQTNDLSLSPVSQAYALYRGLQHAYTIPTLEQVFEFVAFYEFYYRSILGSGHADAARRAANAARIRFNSETKLNPREDLDHHGNVFSRNTASVDTFAQTVTGAIVRAGLQTRADVQSFDFRTLLKVHEMVPAIRTVFLFGDFPKVGNQGDGTNLQPDQSGNTPWMAGLHWPYRVTTESHPFTARGSGGFEGMALSTDGTKLLPLLEKPLVGGTPGELLISEFDIATKSYTGLVHRYALDPRGAAIGDFVMFSPTNGLIIERDGSQGNLGGHKKVYEVRLDPAGGAVVKREAIDLLNIRDPYGISSPVLAGDVGTGSTFAFPFVTIEGVIFYTPHHIAITNDNNFPFSIGRHTGTGRPDDEFIVITLDTALGQL